MERRRKGGVQCYLFIRPCAVPGRMQRDETDAETVACGQISSDQYWKRLQAKGNWHQRSLIRVNVMSIFECLYSFG